MYLFLESISEFLDRFSLAIVGGLIGILVVSLLWNKLPKSKPALRKARLARPKFTQGHGLILAWTSIPIIALSGKYLLDGEIMGLYLLAVGLPLYGIGINRILKG